MPTFTHMIQVVDSHTAGEPTRIVTSGIPHIPGASVAEKWQYAKEHLNDLRRLIMLEPRGHSDMFGAVLTPACSPEADYGLLFCDSGGWLTMCGHGTIGTAVTLVKTGMAPATEPETIIRFETPAGLVVAHVIVEDGEASRAWIENVPSFLFAHDLALDVPGVGSLRVDIAFGGNFFLVVPVEQVGLTIDMRHNQRLVELGMTILGAANKTFDVQHPVATHIDSIGLVEFTQPAGDGADYRNVVIFGEGNFDRSPCGTGTCARMAELHAQGKLALDTPFVHESILGTRFQGELVGTTRVGQFDAVIPRVGGAAYITGMNTLVLEPDDPLSQGFHVPRGGGLD